MWFIILIISTYICICLPLYLTLNAARNALQYAYIKSKNINTKALEISKKLGSLVPLISYFTLQMIIACETNIQAYKLYYENTPWCTYSPNTINWGNLDWKCLDSRAGYGGTDLTSGLWEYPVYKTNYI